MTVKVNPRCHATLLAENSSEEPVSDEKLVEVRDRISGFAFIVIVVVGVVSFVAGEYHDQIVTALRHLVP